LGHAVGLERVAQLRREAELGQVTTVHLRLRHHPQEQREQKVTTTTTTRPTMRE